MPAGSPMLKLDREINNVKKSILQAYIFTYIYVVIPSLFIKEEDDPLFIESG